MRRASALICGLVAALLPASHAAAESAGILPVAGDQQLAAQLNPALGRAVAGRGQPTVLGPVEVQARLAGEPAVAAALQRAREAIALAKEHELRMNRPAAVAAARKAIATLEQVRCALHLPELVIRAHTSHALALLLRPDDPEAASQAFRRVVALDPAFQPTPGQLPPRAARLLEETQPRGQPQPPSASDLGWIARRLKLSQVLWVGLSRPGGEEAGVQAQVVLYDHDSKRIRTRRQQRAAEGRLLQETADLVVETLGGAQVAGPKETPPPAPPVRRPWYRRWWVWAAAGVVVAGAAVGIGLAVTQSQDSGTDIHFHF